MVMSGPNKLEFSWEKEVAEEKDAYALREKNTDASYMQQLLKQTSLQDVVLLSEILNPPYF